MINSNASNTLGIDPFEKASSRYNGNASERVGGTNKVHPEAGTAIERFKQAIKEGDIAPKAYKKLLEEAVEIIESL